MIDGDNSSLPDFITVGSPLGYADFLFGGRTRLEHSQAMGGAPTCPPEPKLDRDPAAEPWRAWGRGMISRLAR